MKTRMLGLYVGAAVDPAWDWNARMKQIADAGYNAISVFLSTVFKRKPGFRIWTADFSAITPEFREHLRPRRIKTRRSMGKAK